VKRSRVSPELRELFEQRGVDVIRAIATTVSNRESPLLFTGGIKATVGDWRSGCGRWMPTGLRIEPSSLPG
jgi:hypothetical protein